MQSVARITIKHLPDSLPGAKSNCKTTRFDITMEYLLDLELVLKLL